MEIKKTKKNLEVVNITLEPDEVKQIIIDYLFDEKSISVSKVSFNISSYAEDRRGLDVKHELGSVSCKGVDL